MVDSRIAKRRCVNPGAVFEKRRGNGANSPVDAAAGKAACRFEARLHDRSRRDAESRLNAGNGETQRAG
jgi:hypothetical protein